MIFVRFKIVKCSCHFIKVKFLYSYIVFYWFYIKLFRKKFSTSFDQTLNACISYYLSYFRSNIKLICFSTCFVLVLSEMTWDTVPEQFLFNLSDLKTYKTIQFVFQKLQSKDCVKQKSGSNISLAVTWKWNVVGHLFK